MRRFFPPAACLLGCIILLSASVYAQSTFGSIVGVVKDPGDLVIPGAKVTLLSLEDRSTRDAVSDAEGSFQFLNVKAGRYEIDVRADGFNSFKLPSVQLDARQTLRADVSLKVATATETVEVGDTAPMIDTESATLADTKDFLQVSQLPVNYRGATTSSLAVLATVPGTQQDANGNVAVGGGLPSQVQYSVDGASTVNIRQNGALANMNPSSELISEFKVSQFNNNAEFAQLGDITIATKSGTEHYHGSLFEYLQNSMLDATTFGFPSKPHKTFNTFGGSLGGPIKIPGLMKGHAAHIFLRRLRRQPPPPGNSAVSQRSDGRYARGQSDRTLRRQRRSDRQSLHRPAFSQQHDSHCGQPGCINPVAQSLLDNYYTALPNFDDRRAQTICSRLPRPATPTDTTSASTTR